MATLTKFLITHFKGANIKAYKKTTYSRRKWLCRGWRLRTILNVRFKSRGGYCYNGSILSKIW